MRKRRSSSTGRDWPPVLVLSFKRFEFDTATGQQRKIPRHVDFEVVLPIGQGEATYHLRAIIMHRGRIASGHYTSFVRSGLHNQWYYCNDAARPRIVTNVQEQMLAPSEERGEAYMLIYDQ